MRERPTDHTPSGPTSDSDAQRDARREADRYKHQIGLQRKKDRAVMIVVRQMLVEYEQGRAASSCMAEIRKAAAE